MAAADISGLYDPMLERDIEGIRGASRELARRSGELELFRAVSRFAILACNPAQHGKHALASVVAAWDLQDELRAEWVALLTECAIYAAEARLPWSEPPLPDPPPLDPAETLDAESIRRAIRESDRRLGERWLASRIDDPQLARDYFLAATEDLSDLGHPLIVATAAWKLSALQDLHPSFPTLRVGVQEWCSKREDSPPISYELRALDDPSLAGDLVEELGRRDGELEAFHALALLDAALEARKLGAPPEIEARVRQALPSRGDAQRAAESRSWPDTSPLPVYPLARDYGQLLKAWAISSRLVRRFPRISRARIIGPAAYNLLTSSFDEWSFA